VIGWRRTEPKHLVDRRRRMSKALVDYPVYEPPHRQGPNGPRDLSDQEAREFWARGKENFSHFMEHRIERQDALRAFLANFDVAMTLEQAGLAAVSAWLPGNCGALVRDIDKEETIQIFFRYLVPWVGDLRGLNVIFDLGIFFGECVIFRYPRLHRINQSNPESRRVGERQVSLIRQRTKSLRSSSDLLTATGRYWPMHNVPSRLCLCNSGGPE
jgi:hypothetical protein